MWLLEMSKQRKSLTMIPQYHSKILGTPLFYSHWCVNEENWLNSLYTLFSLLCIIFFCCRRNETKEQQLWIMLFQLYLKNRVAKSKFKSDLFEHISLIKNKWNTSSLISLWLQWASYFSFLFIKGQILKKKCNKNTVKTLFFGSLKSLNIFVKSAVVIEKLCFQKIIFFWIYKNDQLKGGIVITPSHSKILFNVSVSFMQNLRLHLI